jgi:hypothetical protein
VVDLPPVTTKRGGRPEQEFTLLIERLAWIVLADDSAEWLSWRARWGRLRANRKLLLDAARKLRRREIRCPLIGAEIGYWERATEAMYAEIWDWFSAALEAKKPSVLARLDHALVEGEIEMLANVVLGPETADPLNRLLPPMARIRRHHWGGNRNETPWPTPRQSLAHILAAPVPQAGAAADPAGWARGGALMMDEGLGCR